MKLYSCCFTGHRTIPPEDELWLRQALPPLLENLFDRGFQTYLCGGARGFDTLAAQAVLALRERHPAVRLALILPCAQQTKGWPAEDTALYNFIKTQADQVTVLSPRYYAGCMQRRNRALVDGAALCVAYCTRPQGGTAYTVAYARHTGKEVHLLIPANKKTCNCPCDRLK